MPLSKDQAWFPAKRYGYGWGLPSRWHGWVVFFAYFTALFGGVGMAGTDPAWFVAYVLVLSAVLLAVCWWKGEPPRWRWGDDR